MEFSVLKSTSTAGALQEETCEEELHCFKRPRRIDLLSWKFILHWEKMKPLWSWAYLVIWQASLSASWGEAHEGAWLELQAPLLEPWAWTSCLWKWAGFLLFLSLATPRQVGSLFPNKRWNLCPLQWKHRILTTELPGNSRQGFLYYKLENYSNP